jgi:hypothetical protein
MRPCWKPGSSPLRSTPGRTRTCDPLHVKEVPSPLGHGSRSVVPAGFEPAISTMSEWRALRCSTRLSQSGRQESNLPRTAYQTVASPPGPRPVSSARTEGFEPSACGLEPHCSPRSTSLFLSCPGRIRTCTRLGNNQPHNHCATGHRVRMVGFEPTISSTPS